MDKLIEQIDWEWIRKNRPDLMFLNLGEGRAAVISIINNLLRFNVLHEAIGCPDTVWYEFDFETSKGDLTDLVLFHFDGSISLIKIIDDINDENGVINAIDKICTRALQICHSRSYSEIRKYLLCPVRGRSPDTLLAILLCAREGVSFVPLGEVSQHQREADLILKRMLRNNDARLGSD